MRVFVADDSVIFRKIISEVLSEIPGVEIVGTAVNGKIALDKIRMLKPDFVTLDIEMPEMTGIEVLQALKKDNMSLQVVVVSSLTLKGGELTIKALELGAVDFITKPTSGTIEENKFEIKRKLSAIVKVFASRLGKFYERLNPTF